METKLITYFCFRWKLTFKKVMRHVQLNCYYYSRKISIVTKKIFAEGGEQDMNCRMPK